MGKSTFLCEWLPTLFNLRGKSIIVKFVDKSLLSSASLIDKRYDEIRCGLVTVAEDTEQIQRCHFLNALHRAYQSNDCLGISMKDVSDVITRYKHDPALFGQVVLKISLLAYISSKYGGFSVHYNGKVINIPACDPRQIDAAMQKGRLASDFPIFDGAQTSWEKVCTLCIFIGIYAFGLDGVGGFDSRNFHFRVGE